MAINQPLKAIGYWSPSWEWGSAPDQDFPDPRLLVRRGWRKKERRQILAYLNSGHEHAGYAGYSYCRFWFCWTPHRFMGDFDLTDGVWVWPQGLAHYVRRHSVSLPDEFVATMQANGWRIPENIASPQPWVELPTYDYSYWIAWSHQQKRRPWRLPW